MLRTEYLTIEDFKIVNIAQHCDWDKLNIAINEALSFDLPEITEDYYGLILDAFNKGVNKEDSSFNDDFNNDFGGAINIRTRGISRDFLLTNFVNDLLNGVNYQCGKRTVNFLGFKQMLVYYSTANYMLNNHMNDSGFGYVQKTDPFSTNVQMKDIKEHSNALRNKGYSIFKQLKKYVCHYPELANEYNLSLNCDCSCKNDNHFTEKRIYTFRPKIIKR